MHVVTLTMETILIATRIAIVEEEATRILAVVEEATPDIAAILTIIATGVKHENVHFPLGSALVMEKPSCFVES